MWRFVPAMMALSATVLPVHKDMQERTQQKDDIGNDGNEVRRMILQQKNEANDTDGGNADPDRPGEQPDAFAATHGKKGYCPTPAPK